LPLWIGVIKNKAIFTHLPDRTEWKIKCIFRHKTNGLILFYSFAGGPSFIKEKEKLGKSIFFFIYNIFLLHKGKYTSGEGMGDFVARMMTLPSATTAREYPLNTSTKGIPTV